MSAQSKQEAFGQPGASPTWTHGDKDGVGTAYSVASRLWYTIWSGIVTEVYFPTVDRPQIRDLQYVFCDGSSVEDETVLHTTVETVGRSLGYLLKGRSDRMKFSYEKEIIADPHLPCLLQHTTVRADGDTLQRLKIYALCAPRLDVRGWGNHAQVLPHLNRKFLLAQRNGVWLAMAASQPFSKASVGYIGASDGWTDLHQHRSLEWEFASAPDGHVALTGEIDLSQTQEFTLGLAFGNSRHRALATLLQSLAIPFDRQRKRFLDQWERAGDDLAPLDDQSGDEGRLYRTSVGLLLAHEDKLNPGAMIASLAIPWGEAKGDEEGEGGYHLVWTRDLVQSALGLLAAGKAETPVRALIYLAASQREDGSFAQNFWVDGEPFWSGLQLDEVAFPILLAHRLWKEGDLQLQFRLDVMGLRAIGYLLREGPITIQERWEEAGGFSPSTLAVVIAALICASDFTRSLGDHESAAFLEQYADWLERNIETWTVTREGTLVPGLTTHYVRLTPAQPGEAPPEDGVKQQMLSLTSQAPGSPSEFPAKEIVDAGFLELVRYGIRRADDPVVIDSLKVIDAVLKADTESGTAWRRYNHDGYGQGVDGAPYTGHGQGRAWPLLTGERGHYEIAAGRSAADYIRWMEGLTTPTHLIPEQSWDEPNTSDGKLRHGRPTGSAVPLLWAHAEYIKLLRSARDRKVFDRIDVVADRYGKVRPAGPAITIWSFACPTSRVAAGSTLRLLAHTSFELRWSWDDWASPQQIKSQSTRLGVDYVDVEIPHNVSETLRFTFYWCEVGRWEGRDFAVAIPGS